MTSFVLHPHWKTRVLREVAVIDRRIVDPSTLPHGTRYIGLEHIDTSGQFVNEKHVGPDELASAKFSFGPQHVLYGKLRPYLRKTALPSFSGVCSTDILPIRPSPQLSREFLFHFLRHPAIVAFVTSRCSGANLPRLSPSHLEDLPVPLPYADDPPRSLAAQRRIAAILDLADAIRRKRQSANRVAEQIVPSLFDSMFADWTSAPVADMPRLGDPELSDIASGVTKGRRFNGQKTVTVPYVRVANVQDGVLDLSEIKTIEALPSDVENLRLQHGDVLMTEGGDFDKLGRGAMWDADIPSCIHQNHVFRVRCNRKRLLPLYLASYIRTAIARTYFLKCAKKTSNLASMNLTQLKATPVACPPLDQQRRFAADVEQVTRLCRRQAESRHAADELFQSLVQRAFRGEL